MSRPLRILSVTSVFPYPPIGGTKILVERQVSEMARHHDVDLVAVECGREEDFDHRGLASCRSIRVVTLEAPERVLSPWQKVATTLRMRHPFFLYQRHSARAAAIVEELATSGGYDVVVAEDNEAGLYVQREFPGLKVLTKHSILSVQRRQLAGLAPSGAARWRDFAYARLLERYERDEARRFDVIKLPTPHDLGQWRDVAGEGVAAAFSATNGVDMAYFAYEPRTGPVERLIFTANFAGVQNEDAAVYLLEAILPRVHAQAGPLPLYLVGKNPPPALAAKAAGRAVTVTGAVDDVRPFYGRKAIAVVPLRIASGIINKVLEPMAMGVAVVASREAVAGLEAPADEICLVADDPDGYARAVARLVRDEALYARLTTAAHAYVRRTHDWSAVLSAYRRQIEAYADRGRAPERVRGRA